MTERETLKQWLSESENIVFFGGAGVSTESKIPDFRSTDGLYNQQYAYPPETILSHTFYMRRPEEFYRFYRNKMLFPDAEPNRAHKALAKLDQHTLQKAVYYISNADVLIIGGTSLTVYPAAGLIDYYGGKKLVLINKSVTPMDSRADLVISGPIGEILGDAAGV